MSKRKFHLISHVFYPDEVSTASLFTDLCSVLASDGIEVEVWAAHPSYTSKKRQPREIIHKGIRIKYLASTNFVKSSIVGKTINIFTFAFSVVVRILFSKDKTPLWTHTTYPLTGILLSLICPLKKRKYVYILLDIFPEGLIRLGKLSVKNPLIMLWKAFFSRSLRKSEKIIVIGRDMAHWLEKNYPECENKTIYIPHWQNEENLYPKGFSTNEFVIAYGLNNKFVVQYSGNMGLWNDMKAIGRAVQKNIDDVIFFFVGGGMRKKELTDEFSDKNISNVIMLPFQESGNFNEVLAASHVQIVSLRKGLEGMAVPSKIYGILASGKPVLAMVPEESEIAYIVREEKCGIVIDPSDTEGLIDGIKKLKADENLCKIMGKNSYQAFKKKYTSKIIAGKYKEHINLI